MKFRAIARYKQFSSIWVDSLALLVEWLIVASDCSSILDHFLPITVYQKDKNKIRLQVGYFQKPIPITFEESLMNSFPF